MDMAVGHGERRGRTIALVVLLAAVPMLVPVMTLWGLQIAHTAIRVPGKVTPLAVQVDGDVVPFRSGSISTVSFRRRPVRRLEWLLLRHRSGITVEPLRAPGLSSDSSVPMSVRAAAGLRRLPNVYDGRVQVDHAQAMAIVAAMRAAGADADLEGQGIVLEGPTVLRSVVAVAAGERPLRTYFDWVEAVRAAGPGGSIRLGLGSGEHVRVRVPEARSPAWREFGPGGALVDTVSPVVTSTHAVAYPYVEAGASGPSGGLAFAIAAYVALVDPHLIDRLDIVATGIVQPDGHVVVVPGIEPKTAAAIDAGADIVIVPKSSEPAARATAHGRIRVVGVDTLDQAISALRDRAERRR